MNTALDLESIRAALAATSPNLVTPRADARRAAVALVLRPGETGPEALFVKRAEVEADPWSGQMALPGGHRDPEDVDLLDTARRETLEEVGVALDREAFLGQLDDRHPISPGLPSIVVSSFVAWGADAFEIRANYEVQYHHWVPVSALADPAFRSELRHGERGQERAYPSILFAGDSIWGLTHRIVINFLEILDRESIA